MERKIDDVFEYHTKMLKVKLGVGCNGCYFIGRCIEHNWCITGECNPLKRQDNKKVIFVEVKDEQPQELNLCEILKNCPIGTKFWSPLLGDVELSFIRRSSVSVRYYTGGIWDINSDGTTTLGNVTSPEIMLFPSREQRDWTKVKYEPKKERFDPKTLKAFDKVLVNNENNTWQVELFSHMCQYGPNNWYYQCAGDYYYRCLPYNDDTKHLVGTKDEAPVFYRYWED